MKIMKNVYQDDFIYLYDWHSERMQSKSTLAVVGATVLDDADTYHYYLERQNLTSKDTDGPDYMSRSINRIFPNNEPLNEEGTIKRYSFCRKLKGDEFIILNIKDLKQTWDSQKKEQAEPIEEYDYMLEKGFRSHPVKGCGVGRKSPYYRRIKHMRMVLNELSLSSEHRLYGENYSNKRRIDEDMLDWDWYGHSRTVSNSWKDQSKKQRQWL